MTYSTSDEVVLEIVIVVVLVRGSVVMGKN